MSAVNEGRLVTCGLLDPMHLHVHTATPRCVDPVPARPVEKPDDMTPVRPTPATTPTPHIKRLVIVESPFGKRPDGTTCDGWEVERNVKYARAALADSLRLGEAPLASHLLYPGTLDDTNADDRRRGMDAGLAWGPAAHATVVYIDLGVTPGMVMVEGIRRALAEGREVEVRSLDAYRNTQISYPTDSILNLLAALGRPTKDRVL